MTVRLRTSRQLRDIPEATPWIAVTGSARPADRPGRMSGAAARLDAAFSAIRDDWWALGRELAKNPTAAFAHAPTCASYASDLGIMMAWGRIARELVEGGSDALMICDDPWVFRHLREVDGIEAGRAPGLFARATRLRLRGMAARLSRCRHHIRAHRAFRDHRNRLRPRSPAMIVYGHPESRADGSDAYFGSLMKDMPGLIRMIHTDCDIARGEELSARDDTACLHGWGSRRDALAGLFGRWRPTAEEASGAFGWLIRRAAALENSRAGMAGAKWQVACQQRWLNAAIPPAVVWPWENHPWERQLVRATRSLKTRTIGYQHTVIGRHIYNYAARCNPDGTESLPDTVLCNGPAYGAQLVDWGLPRDRLDVGGAFRLTPPADLAYDPTGPVFVALSADAPISAEMIAAVDRLGAAGRKVLVKDHPMYPFDVEAWPNVTRTETPLPQQKAVSAAIYSTGAVGLEALMAGLPTIRFLPEARVAIDILPQGTRATPADADTLNDVLDGLAPPDALNRENVVAPVDLTVWRRYLLAA